MQGKLYVRNWQRFQHYKNRCPPWIKLHTDTYQNADFAQLPEHCKTLLVGIWTIASRTKDGSIVGHFPTILRQLCLTHRIRPRHLQRLIDSGFLELGGVDDSNVIAERKQTAMPEERRERETLSVEAFIPESNTVVVEAVCAERLENNLSAPPAISIPLNDNSEFPIFRFQVDEWQKLYPAVDVEQELRNIRGWNLSNPVHRKTKRGILRHVNSWLQKEQNNGHRGNQAKKPTLDDIIRLSRIPPEPR